MLNPELKRHIWLKGSLFNLLVAPLIAVLFLFLFMLNYDADIPRTEQILIYASFAILMCYGVYLANQSLANDFKEQTWDQQRMSAMSAWSLTWGKLLGSTLMAWYLVSVIWIAYCIIYLIRYKTLPLSTLSFIPSFTCMALALQSLSLALTLYLDRTKRKMGLSMVPMILLIFFIYSLMGAVPSISRITNLIVWWHFEFSTTSFLFFSSVLALVISLIFAWRIMRIRLLMGDYPWAWICFIILINLYIMGLLSNVSQSVFFPLKIIRFNVFLVITISFFYCLLFTESFSFAQAHRLLLRFKSRQWPQLFKAIPLFLVTYFIIILAYIYATFQLVSSIFILSILLFMLRDTFIVMALYFSKRFKGTIMSVMSILIINMILPYILIALSQPNLAEYFNPYINADFLKYSALVLHGAPTSYKEVFILSCHSILAGGLMWMNWRSRMDLLPK